MDIPVVTANGARIPQIGLGTFRIAGDSCEEQVVTALSLGYRHIDTAFFYQNHQDIARAIARSKIARSELFITTKIWYDHLAYDDVIAYGNQALKELGMTYVDLLLIHWPNKSIPLSETLRAMKQLQDEGKVRAIGVSNFTAERLEEAIVAGKKLGVRIVCDQVEFHPFLYQRDLLTACEKHGVALVAYRPFANGKVFTDPAIAAIAAAHGKTGGQVALRWMLDKGIIVIPKASSRAHLAENLDLDFSLTSEETAVLDALPQSRLVRPPFAEF